VGEAAKPRRQRLSAPELPKHVRPPTAPTSAPGLPAKSAVAAAEWAAYRHECASFNREAAAIAANYGSGAGGGLRCLECGHAHERKRRRLERASALGSAEGLSTEATAAAAAPSGSVELLEGQQAFPETLTNPSTRGTPRGSLMKGPSKEKPSTRGSSRGIAEISSNGSRRPTDYADGPPKVRGTEGARSERGEWGSMVRDTAVEIS
jgi:hypothetical protein